MLERYKRILKGNIEPYFIKAKKVKLDIDLHEKSLEELWKIHDKQMEENVPSIKLKKEISGRLIRNCILCERKCRVNREKGEVGHCGVSKSKISSEFIHMGEESVLVPSHTIFFTGCNFNCVFCQNWEISQSNRGRYIEPKILAGMIEGTRAKNVNWVGGDPTPNIPYIIDVLSNLSKRTPQVWNSNMYLTMEGMKVISKLMDLYLTDFKYGNDECANKLSNVENYTEVIRRNHKIAEKTGDIIIRHLVLPEHIECCTKPILNWIDKNLDSPMVNIMSQYRPVYESNQYPKIDRFLNEYEENEIHRLKRKYSHLIL